MPPGDFLAGRARPADKYCLHGCCKGEHSSCNRCNETFKMENALKVHIKRKHFFDKGDKKNWLRGCLAVSPLHPTSFQASRPTLSTIAMQLVMKELVLKHYNNTRSLSIFIPQKAKSTYYLTDTACMLAEIIHLNFVETVPSFLSQCLLVSKATT